MKIASLVLATIATVALSHRALAQGCGNSVGITPLNDLGAGTYLGYQGGLYPAGSNLPPAQHLADALAQADLVVPRATSGAPEPGCGLIGMISIGMSNTTHEFAVFERQEDTNTSRNPRVVIATCSQGGQSAEAIDDPNAPYWDLVDERVAAAGLSPAQVQVAWLKEALGNETYTFPGDALTLQTSLSEIARILRDKFPNLRLCYVSSRIYGGYNTGHTEPVSFEGGFAAKWLIEAQINGAPNLNWNPSAGAVESPLLLWGPYLWADGQTPRSDGLTWCQSDLENDGTHPSPAGEQKVADLLSTFFDTDATVQAWYADTGLEPLVATDADADATVLSAQPTINFGADATLRIESQPQVARAYLRFDFSAVERPVVHAKLSLRNLESPSSTGSIAARVVSDTSWSESSITFANAPGASGASLVMPNTSRDGARSLDVTDWVNADGDGVLSIVLVGAAANAPATFVHSREGGWAPRLVLSTRPGAWVSYCTSGTTSNGCLATMSASGIPSVVQSSGFVLTAASVEGDRPGLIFYGINGRVANPWGVSFLCVRAPVQRTGTSSSGGGAGTCNGSLALDWLAYLSTHPNALGQPFAAGQLVNTQCWFRDPLALKTTNLSDALEFFACP